MMQLRPFAVTTVTLILVVVGLLTFHQPVGAELLPQELIDNGGYVIAKQGRVLEQYRQSDLFVPASTVKLLSTLAVLRTLGKDYRFQTRFYHDSNQVLYIEGSGDPFLTSETLALIAADLKTLGLRKVSAFVLDDSRFNLEHPLPDGSKNSHNPYDVANSALAVNFNSIALTRKKDGTIVSAEPQTPLTHLASELGSRLATGNHRINIGTTRVAGTIPSSLRYSAELFSTLLEQSGIEASLNIRRGPPPADLEPVYISTSAYSVEEMLRSCLKYSNNFIANQLVLTAAAHTYGYPATWAKARKLLEETAHTQLQIPRDSLQVKEASGLSRDTMMTPDAMMTILQAFRPHRQLLEVSRGVRAKTGTMKSVYCYAGYIEEQGEPVSFVLFLNQQENIRNALLAVLKNGLQHKDVPTSTPEQQQ